MDFHESHPKRRGEDVFALIFLLVSVFLFWQSYAIAGFSALSSPGAFPMAASGIMVLAALIVVVGNARRGRPTSSEPILTMTLALFTLLVIGYAVLLDTLGFLPASFLFLLVGMRLLHRGSWMSILLISVLSLIAIYVIFRMVFQVVLPEGIVPEGNLLAAIGRLFGGEPQ